MSSVEIDISAIVPHCKRAADGIWYAPDDDPVSYPPEGNAECFELEESSFWFQHRNACIEAAVRRHPPPPGEAIFDIGGGNGFVSLGLHRAGFDVVVIEPGRSGAINSRRRGLPAVVCATSSSAGIPRSSLGAVGLFDVIEHIENDVAYLRSLRSLMKDGGRLYATVPAHSALWSAEDVSAGHFRRYTRRPLATALESGGFAVDYATYIFRPLPLPIFMLRTIPFLLGKARTANDTARDARADHVPRPSLATRALTGLLKTEVAAIASGRTMRAGASCLIVATAR